MPKETKGCPFTEHWERRAAKDKERSQYKNKRKRSAANWIALKTVGSPISATVKRFRKLHRYASATIGLRFIHNPSSFKTLRSPWIALRTERSQWHRSGATLITKEPKRSPLDSPRTEAQPLDSPQNGAEPMAQKRSTVDGAEQMLDGGETLGWQKKTPPIYGGVKNNKQPIKVTLFYE